MNDASLRMSESGFPIKPVYEPNDVPLDTAARSGAPGEFPFVRGIHPGMYTNRLWTMRQYAGFATACESNRRYHELLNAGTTGLSIAFDLPTQMGYDSDNPLAHGEVGRVGVAIDSLEDMRTLFDGIPLDAVSVSMTINAPAAVLLLLYQIVAEEQGVSPAVLNGTIQNDILKEYIARGTYIFPPQPSLRLIMDTFAYCNRELPRWNMISISGYHMAEAGATPAQELAFTLANGVAYVRAALQAGMTLDEFAPRLAFFFVVRTAFLEEIAKFRAARRIWARIMREEFGAKNPKSAALRFHTQTAGVQLTAELPELNLVRVSVQALAAVFGGTQSLHTNAYDEALGLPTAAAAQLALRTQQVLAYETDVTSTVDPFAGSYAVESMTDDMERTVNELMARIEAMGGAVSAVERDFQRAEIEEAAYAQTQRIERGEQVVVGVNRFTSPASAGEEYVPLRVDPVVEQAQCERLRALRLRRDPVSVASSLAELRTAAAGNSNVLEPMKAALAAHATVGEVCDALRQEWGSYQP